MIQKLDAFILGLLAMIFLAWLFPQPGIYNGTINLDLITDIGISLIFFFYGLKLSPKQVREGLNNVRLHLLVQVSTFLIFPLLVVMVRPMIGSNGQMLWLAFLFLAALPSTVSSSVVMVVLARGNMVGAIFNASISGLIGIVMTPFWMELFWVGDVDDFNWLQSVWRLIVKILLPVVCGLILHKYWGNWIRKHLKILARFDKTIILLIVYKSFSNSFDKGILDGLGFQDWGFLFLAVLGLFLSVYVIIYWGTKILKFNREDRITAIFCGSKKSLVHGTVFSKVLFKNMVSQGMFLVPIMIYHTLQLVVISIIAQKLGKEK